MEKDTRQYHKDEQKRIRRKRHAKRAVKYVSVLAISSFLANPSMPLFGPGGPLEIHRPMQAYAQESARLTSTASLTGSFTDTGTGPYRVGMQFSGTGVTNNAGGRRRVVFQSPTLGNNLQPTGTATVSATFRQINVNTLSSLNSGLANITAQISSALSGIVGSINAVQNNPLTRRFIRVSGLTELQNAMNNLYNVDAYLRDIPAYTGQITPTVNPDGSISVDFTDQINAHVAQQIQARISGLLTEVNYRIAQLRVEMLGGLASIPLSPLQVLATPIAALIDSINTGGGNVNVLADVASVQPINQLNVTQNATVPRNTQIYGTHNIYAAGTQTTAARPNDMTTRGTYQINVPQTVPPFNIPAPSVEPVHAEQTTITGVSRTDATTIIRVGDAVYEIPPTTTTEGTGPYSYTLPGPLPVGTVVEVYQRDAYNRTTPITTTTVTAPPFVATQPTVNPIPAGPTPTVTGQRDPSTDLVVTTPDGETIVLIEADPNAEPGTSVDFTVDLPFDVAPGDTLEFTQVDEYDRSTPPTTATVEAPPYNAPAPSVNPVNNETTVITGTRNPRDPLIITDADGNTIAELPGNPDANPDTQEEFIVELDSPLAPGTELSVYQTDPYGQQTPHTNLTVTEVITEPEEPGDPDTDPGDRPGTPDEIPDFIYYAPQFFVSGVDGENNNYIDLMEWNSNLIRFYNI
jgi:hypothetical protein